MKYEITLRGVDFINFINIFCYLFVSVCYDWHLLDPMIGMWLMDPDHPPRDFPRLLKEFDLKVCLNLACDYLKFYFMTFFSVFILRFSGG